MLDGETASIPQTADCEYSIARLAHSISEHFLFSKHIAHCEDP